MMTSRGAPEAEALASFVELAAAARDGVLAKATAEYREAQKAADSATKALEAKSIEHSTREAELNIHDVKLNADVAALIVREDEVGVALTDLADRERKLALRTKQIEEFSAEVHQRDEAVRDGEAKLEADAAKLASDTKAKTKQAETAAERIVNKATVEAARISDAARVAADVAGRALDAELAQRRTEFDEEMRTRERALKGREEQFKAERARFSALLQE